MPYSMPLRLGTVTEWGRIDMIGSLQGERYYWMTDWRGVVSMMPADVVEPSVRNSTKDKGDSQ